MAHLKNNWIWHTRKTIEYDVGLLNDLRIRQIYYKKTNKYYFNNFWWNSSKNLNTIRVIKYLISNY